MTKRTVYLNSAETGGLFLLAVRLLQLFSNDQIELKKVVSLLGLFFQIRDDYANLVSTEVSFNGVIYFGLIIKNLHVRIPNIPVFRQ